MVSCICWWFTASWSCWRGVLEPVLVGDRDVRSGRVHTDPCCWDSGSEGRISVKLGNAVLQGCWETDTSCRDWMS